MAPTVAPGRRRAASRQRPAAREHRLYSVAATGPGRGRVADAALAQWRRVEAELSPILGAGGVAALFRHSVHQLRDAHPALAVAHEASGAAADFEPLYTALARLSPTDAATTHRALMQVFRDRLAELIGAPLSERLLRPAGAFSPTGSAAQDTTP